MVLEAHPTWVYTNNETAGWTEFLRAQAVLDERGLIFQCVNSKS